jgi:hypothetical protein
MANNVLNVRFYTLDTVAVIKAVGIPVVVRKIVFFPNAAGDDAAFQEYLADGTLANAIRIKAGPSDASAVMLDFVEGRTLNGLKLSVIDGGSVDVYIGRD